MESVNFDQWVAGQGITFTQPNSGRPTEEAPRAENATTQNSVSSSAATAVSSSDQPQFTCTHAGCNFSCSDNLAVRQHEQSVTHVAEVLFACPELGCSVRLKRARSIRLHVKNVHKKKIGVSDVWKSMEGAYQADYLQVLKAREEMAKAQQKAKRLEKRKNESKEKMRKEKPGAAIFPCTDCDFMAPDVSLLTRHITSVHRKPVNLTISCAICDDRVFDSKEAFALHWKALHSELCDRPSGVSLINGNIPEGLGLPPRLAAVPSATAVPSVAAVPSATAVPSVAAVPNASAVPRLAAVPSASAVPSVAAVPNTLQCNLCPFSCGQPSELVAHAVQCHAPTRTDSIENVEEVRRPPAEEWFHCRICEFRTRRSGKLKGHMRLVHSTPAPVKSETDQMLDQVDRALVRPMDFLCDRCDFVAATHGLLLLHKQKHKTSNGAASLKQRVLYACDSCPFKCDAKSAVRLHMSVAHSLPPALPSALPCASCRYKASSEADMRRHVSAMHDDKNGRRESDQENVAVDFSLIQEKHLVMPSKPDKLLEVMQCPFCDYRSAHKNILGRHIRAHDPEITAAEMASYLGKKVVDTSSISRATPSESVVQPRKDFFCTQCSFSTAYYHSLKKHRMLIHSGVDRDFYSDWKFMCDQCNYATNHAPSFSKHRIMSHFGQPQPVDQCLESSVRAAAENRHTFTCDRCDFTCGRESGIKRHKALVHFDETFALPDPFIGAFSDNSPALYAPGGDEFQSEELQEEGVVQSNASATATQCTVQPRENVTSVSSAAQSFDKAFSPSVEGQPVSVISVAIENVEFPTISHGNIAPVVLLTAQSFDPACSPSVEGQPVSVISVGSANAPAVENVEFPTISHGNIAPVVPHTTHKLRPRSDCKKRCEKNAIETSALSGPSGREVSNCGNKNDVSIESVSQPSQSPIESGRSIPALGAAATVVSAMERNQQIFNENTLGAPAHSVEVNTTVEIHEVSGGKQAPLETDAWVMPELPLKCPRCSFRCRKKASLKMHVDRRHGGIRKTLKHVPTVQQRHQCDQCDYSTNAPSKLRAHRARIHFIGGGKRPAPADGHLLFYCDLCGYASASGRKIGWHKQFHHWKTFAEVDKDLGGNNERVVKRNSPVRDVRAVFQGLSAMGRNGAVQCFSLDKDLVDSVTEKSSATLLARIPAPQPASMLAHSKLAPPTPIGSSELGATGATPSGDGNKASPEGTRSRKQTPRIRSADKRPVEWVIPELPLKCPKCSFRCRKNTSLKMHVSRRHGGIRKTARIPTPHPANNLWRSKLAPPTPIGSSQPDATEAPPSVVGNKASPEGTRSRKQTPRTRSAEKRPVEWVIPELPLKCPKCSFRCRKTTSLKMHVSRRHGGIRKMARIPTPHPASMLARCKLAPTTPIPSSELDATEATPSGDGNKASPEGTRSRKQTPRTRSAEKRPAEASAIKPSEKCRLCQELLAGCQKMSYHLFTRHREHGSVHACGLCPFGTLHAQQLKRHIALAHANGSCHLGVQRGFLRLDEVNDGVIRPLVVLIQLM